MAEWRKPWKRSRIQDDNALIQPETRRMSKTTDPRTSRNVRQRYQQIRVRPSPETKRRKRRAKASATNKGHRAMPNKK